MPETKYSASGELTGFPLIINIPELESKGWIVSHMRRFIVVEEFDTMALIEVIEFITIDEDSFEEVFKHVEFVSLPIGSKRDYSNALVKRYGLDVIDMRHDILANKYKMSETDKATLSLMVGVEPKVAIDMPSSLGVYNEARA